MVGAVECGQCPAATSTSHVQSPTAPTHRRHRPRCPCRHRQAPLTSSRCAPSSAVDCEATFALFLLGKSARKNDQIAPKRPATKLQNESRKRGPQPESLQFVQRCAAVLPSVEQQEPEFQEFPWGITCSGLPRRSVVRCWTPPTRAPGTRSPARPPPRPVRACGTWTSRSSSKPTPVCR